MTAGRLRCAPWSCCLTACWTVCRALPTRGLSDLPPWTTAGGQLLYMQTLIAGDPTQEGCAARLGAYVTDDLINPTLARLAALGPGELPQL